jgi:predicted membrane-bound spermidine synthase
MRLAQRGVNVEVVEINPAAWQAAETYFGFQPSRFRNHLADARGFVRGCGRRGEAERHDLALVDLFQGDGTPEYLTTREFFRDLRLCLKTGGAAVFNTFADMGNPQAYAHLLATLKAEFATVLMFRGDAPPGAQINSFLLATNGPTATSATLVLPDLPATLDADFRWALGRPRPVDRTLLAGGEVVTDARNILSFANARTYLSYRRSVHGAFPKLFLVN